MIVDRSYSEAAEIITDERYDIYDDDDDMDDDDIEITGEELAEQPAMILESNDALNAGAKVQGISVNDYRAFLADEIKEEEEAEEEPQEAAEEENQEERRAQPAVQVSEDNAEFLLQSVIESSAQALNLESDQVSDNLTLLKHEDALAASTELTGLNKEQVTQLANHAMVSSARMVDDSLEFDRETYFWLSTGLLLLILAMSSISFFASTLFNRTGTALAVGGGIPFVFFLMTMVQQLMDSSDVLDYFTITSLFDTDAIYSGGEFGWGLAALAAIALLLYAASYLTFTKKDLPL